MAKKKKKVKKTNQAKDIKRWNFLKLVKYEYVIVGGILLLAIILRVVYLFQLKNNDPYFFTPHEGDDTYMYVTAAKEILDGTFPKVPFGYNPLYYYFLALCYLVSGYNLIFPRVVQFILGVVTCLLTYFIGKQVFNKAVGMIGALLCAVCGTLIFYEGVFLSSALTTFFSCACLFFFIRSKEKGITKNFILGTLCLGLATLSQPNTILFLPFILIWMLITYKIPKKEILIKYALVLLVFFITISPVTIRNCLYGGKFILLTTAGGFQFWIGNNEHTTGSFDLPQCYPYLEKLQKKMKEEKKELYLIDVLDFIKKDPMKFIKIQVTKFLLFWGSFDVPHQVNYELGREITSFLKLPFLITFGELAIIGLVGLFLSLRQFRRLTLLYLFIFVFSFSVIAFVVVGRYRPPVIPFLSLFGGFLIYYLYESFRFKEYKKIVLPCILLIIFTGLVNSQFIIRKLQPNLPYRTIKTEKGFIMRDSSYEWHGGKSIKLTESSVVVKKEFLINENISRIKEAKLWLVLGGKETGSVILKVNEIELGIIPCKGFFGPGGIPGDGLLGKIGIGPIPPSLLKKGLNTFTIDGGEDTYLIFPIDNYYDYNRSHVSYDRGITWEKIKGEYMFELEVKTKEKE